MDSMRRTRSPLEQTLRASDLMNTIFLAERLDPTDELDLKAELGGLLFGVVPDRFTRIHANLRVWKDRAPLKGGAGLVRL